jgi:hypothetical protein
MPEGSAQAMAARKSGCQGLLSTARLDPPTANSRRCWGMPLAEESKGRTMDQAMPWWLRWFLLLGTGQALLIGLTGLLAPEEIQIPVPMSPLNARFVAALYVGAAVGVALSAQMRQRAAARPLAVGFSAAVGLLLIVTLLHWSEFTADGLRHRETWLVTYIVDPLLALLVVPAAYRRTSWAASHHRLTPLFTVEAVLLGGLGLVLLVAPQAAAAIWPCWIS